MKFWTDSFTRIIHGDNAFCIQHAQNHACLGGNHNPHLAWSDLPAGTKSLALICHDPDVPSRGDDVNQEGRTVPASLPRVDFFHWVLVDLPPAPTVIATRTPTILSRSLENSPFPRPLSRGKGRR